MTGISKMISISALEGTLKGKLYDIGLSPLSLPEVAQGGGSEGTIK